jgi:hypothetical protein
MLQKIQTSRIDIVEIDRLLNGDIEVFNKRCCVTKPLFFSYCHKNKIIVHKIADELEKLNFKIWIDRDLTAGVELFPEIEKGIIESHMIICFISNDYCKSNNCQNEITFSKLERKQILPIMLEKVFNDCSNGVMLNLAGILRFNSYEEGSMFEPWSKDHFEKLSKTIHDTLSKLCTICSESVLETVNIFEKNEKTVMTGKDI